MRIQQTPLRCLACHHEWTGEIVSDAPADVVIASMRALHCPKCYADSERIAMRLMRGQEAAP